MLDLPGDGSSKSLGPLPGQHVLLITEPSLLAPLIQSSRLFDFNAGE